MGDRNYPCWNTERTKPENSDTALWPIGQLSSNVTCMYWTHRREERKWRKQILKEIISKILQV